MARRRTLLSAVMMMACIAFLGIRTDGHAQENRAASREKPVIQQSPPSQALQPYQRTKRRGLIVVADVSVTPLTYSGSCPAIFTLKGQIYVNEPMMVLYKIIRSDNMPMEPIALTFEKEERKEITYTWKLGDPAKSASFNEWALIEAVYPVNTKIRSNVVFLKGSCGDQTDLKPQALSSQSEGQKGQPGGPMGFPGIQAPGKGPVPTGLPVDPPGQQRPPATGNFPLMPPAPGGQGPSSLPMLQPGQTGQGPGSMPVMPSVSGGPGPSSLPMLQPDVKVLPGTEK
jgi:hypothetical protein